jgi:hypothetical protein
VLRICRSARCERFVYGAPWTLAPAPTLTCYACTRVCTQCHSTGPARHLRTLALSCSPVIGPIRVVRAPARFTSVIPGRSTSHRIASRQWEATVSPCHLCTFLWPIGADLVAHVQIPTALSIHLLSITLSQHADSRSRQIPAGRSETARPVLTRVEDVSRRCNFWVSCPGDVPASRL